MLVNTLADEGLASWAGQVESDEEIIFDINLRYSDDKTLIAYELDANLDPSPVTGCTIEGRFYDETDGDYADLETGDDLSTGASGDYDRYLIRITADTTAAVLERRFQFTLIDT